MPRTPLRKPDDQPTNEVEKALIIHPLTEVAPTRTRAAGRPAKLVMPALPKMEMTDLEQDLFDYFIEAHQQEYPDLTPTDHMLLHLAGLEYIKYLRIVAWELESHKVISMARQHPGTNMRALLDQLSVTRRARNATKKPDEDPEAKELRDYLMSMGKQARRSGSPL